MRCSSIGCAWLAIALVSHLPVALYAQGSAAPAVSRVTAKPAAAEGATQSVSPAGANQPGPSPGISETLALERAGRVSDLRYDVQFDIPAEPTSPVAGLVTLRFELRTNGAPLAIDFEPAATHTKSVATNGRATTWTASNGHIVLPASDLRVGRNEVAIVFQAGDRSLNRNADFLYSLFVPARAHLAFPCFDQPSLKGRYSLTLTVPAAWRVVANGAEETRETTADERVTVRFAETKPLATYLFAFAAGRFSVETAERSGRTFRMFHRETDAAKVARNRDALFDLHARALTWLEDYTGIPYPWGKFDFVLIPSFQFGGMEHAGAILYNASGMMLEETATVNQQLGRASTIAHETAHMWFGDLVTMRWFNDVWMKEVFANFMAAKIVNPSFPEVNHDLRFLLAHYPAAYGVDRTAGANAIRQELANLSDAGSLYGAIIYEKAPIVMRNLETLMGADAFRDGLREYLARYSFTNATWPELIAILDRRSADDLETWSRAWVGRPGRPTIRTMLAATGGRIANLAISQADPRRRGVLWNQQVQVTMGYTDAERTFAVRLAGRQTLVTEAAGLPQPLYVLANGAGVAYGQIELDAASRRYLLAHLDDVANPLTRGSAWVTLWDELLRGAVAPSALIDLAVRALPRETDELNAQQALSYLRGAYWRFGDDSVRRKYASTIEDTLWQQLQTARSQSLKSAYFRAYRDLALTTAGVERLMRVWRRDEKVAGLTFSETDEIALALELAVRGGPAWKSVLDEQSARIENPDRKARFAFVRPALDADAGVRDRFFASLADVRNRGHEPWVTEALAYLHHPLRAAASEKYIPRSLRLLPEIQRTGDIFFPKNWMDATLVGHSSPVAAAHIRQYLASLPTSFPARLRMTIEASADELFRAAAQRVAPRSPARAAPAASVRGGRSKRRNAKEQVSGGGAPAGGQLSVGE